MSTSTDFVVDKDADITKWEALVDKALSQKGLDDHIYNPDVYEAVPFYREVLKERTATDRAIFNPSKELRAFNGAKDLLLEERNSKSHIYTTAYNVVTEDNKARGIITKLLDDRTRVLVRNLTARGAYMAVLEHYRSLIRASGKTWIARLAELQLDGDVSPDGIKNYLKEREELANKCRIAFPDDTRFSLDNQANIVCSRVPEMFDHLSEHDDNPEEYPVTWDKLKSAMLNLVNSDWYQKKYGGKRQVSDVDQPHQPSRHNNKKSVVKCKICNKNGHTTRDCRAPGAAEARKLYWEQRNKRPAATTSTFTPEIHESLAKIVSLHAIVI